MELSASLQDEICKTSEKFHILHFTSLYEDWPLSDSISYLLQNISNLLHFKIPVSFQGDRKVFLSLAFPWLSGISVFSLSAVKTQRR